MRMLGRNAMRTHDAQHIDSIARDIDPLIERLVLFVAVDQGAARHAAERYLFVGEYLTAPRRVRGNLVEPALRIGDDLVLRRIAIGHHVEDVWLGVDREFVQHRDALAVGRTYLFALGAR